MSANPIEVLLIEDNDGDARLIEEMLRESPVISFQLIGADCLTKGFDLLSERRFDVLLLDLGLPESQGLETLERVISHPVSVPVIINTGLDDEMLGIRGVQAGAQDYLIKGQTNSFVLRRSICHAIMRFQIKQALMESEARYHAMFSTMNAGVAVCNVIGDGEDFVFRDFNAAAERISRVSRDKVIGKRLLGVFPNMDRFGLFAAFRKVSRTGSPEHIPPKFYKDPFREGWEEIFIYKLPSGEVVAIFEDVTERKQAEEALNQINKKLNLMSSVTRHDILNQITVISGFLELLKRRLSESKDLEYVLQVTSAIRNIERQIIFTRAYQEIGVHNPEWQNVDETIRQAASQLSSGPVAVEVNPDNYEVYADPLLVKVFYNLIDNSLCHGEKNTKIRFYSRLQPDHLTIIGEDDGVGIPDNEKEQIFERGYGKHTGFGLFLAREILSITGITIKETGEPGTGARFEIQIPDGGYRLASQTPGKNPA